jgi:hypothetical protein
VFENRLARRIFISKRGEVTGGWRKLYNKVFRYLYSSSNIIRIIKYSRMTWEGNIVRMGENRAAGYKLLVRDQDRTTPL